MTIKESFLKTFKLAKAKAVGMMAGVPLAMKTTPDIARVDLKLLEQDYRTNPVIFNGINKIVQIMMSTKRSLEAKDKNIESFYSDFLDNIGRTGGELNWDGLLEAILKHQAVYGRAWVELIHNKKGNRIVDLDFIDPKKMDYAKTSGDKIALDRFGNPIGYIETLPATAITIEKRQRFTPPEAANILLQHNQIYFPPERIAHFQLYRIGDGFYGIGLVEPIHIVAISKDEMQKALVNAMWRAGFPTPVLKAGDKDHEPTPEQIRNKWEKLKKMNYRYGFSMPYYDDLQFLEASHPEKLKEHLNFFIEQEITGLGLAKAFATGTGERGTNRAILTRQEFVLKLTLRDIIKQTVRTIESKIFRRIAELEGFKEIPKFKWGEIVLQELDSKASRLIGYAKTGLITPDAKTEEYIRRAEDLPLKE